MLSMFLRRKPAASLISTGLRALNEDMFSPPILPAHKPTNLASPPPGLCRLQDTLPQQREARPPIALALHELEAMELALGDAVTPLQGQPRGDGDQVILEPAREAG